MTSMASNGGGPDDDGTSGPDGGARAMSMDANGEGKGSGSGAQGKVRACDKQG